MYYLKATRLGGVSFHDANFVYHLGLNVHPNPDKSSVVCGVGIHLAKSLRAAFYYVPKAEEVYLAKPGPILGEGDDKVRVAYCFIIKKLTRKQVDILRTYEGVNLDDRQYNEIKKEWGDLFSTGGIAGKQWLERYLLNFPFSEAKTQGLELIKGDRVVSRMTTNLTKKEIREVIASHKN